MRRPILRRRVVAKPLRLFVRLLWEHTFVRMSPQIADLAYDAALRGLAQQEGSLNELRARAGTLLAASSIATSFIGGRGLDHGGFSAWSVLALAALISSLVASICVLVPRDGLVFALSVPVVFETLYGLEPAEARRRLAYWIQGYRGENQPIIRRVTRAYRLASVATVLSVILWILDLATV